MEFPIQLVFNIVQIEGAKELANGVGLGSVSSGSSRPVGVETAIGIFARLEDVEGSTAGFLGDDPSFVRSINERSEWDLKQM